MHELDDHDLLRQYAEQNSETAFAALVARNVDKVYSTALRHTRNAHAAEEITQAVFVILAKKSGRLGGKVILAGWLYETARLTALTYIRSEIRRARREQEAHMQTALNQNDDDAWPHIAPLLDDALAGLSAADRHAVVLRYFDGKSLGEVGAALGASEDAAKKRVTRAVEKLRGWFTKRGVTLTATVLTAAISANSVQAAPLGLAATVAATAVKGTLISAALTTLVKTTMKTMTWLKIKFAAGVGIAALLAGGVATVAVSQTGTGDDDWTPQEIAKQSLDAYAALTSYSDNGTGTSDGGGVKITFNTRLQRPNLYRLGWTRKTDADSNTGVVWSEGSGDFFLIAPTGHEQDAQPTKVNDMQLALASAMALSGQLQSIPATFYNKNFGEMLGVMATGKCELKKKGDEKIGGVDCHVFSGKMELAKIIPKTDQEKLPMKIGNLGITTTTLWIGKRDHFIHQIQTADGRMSLALPRPSDDDIKTMLEKVHKPATPADVANFRKRTEAAMKNAQNSSIYNIYCTETHENIVVNQKFSPSDFAR